MGKTYRKDGKNRNKFYAQKRKSVKRLNNKDYDRIIIEHEEDEKLNFTFQRG